MGFWKDKRVLVTGGAGFLGSYVTEKLKEKGCKEIFVPRSKDYNLVEMEAVKRVYADAKPDIVIHLSAKVGGIGANRANPGKFFYDNLMMGVQMIEVGRQVGIEKFVALATICSYPKFTPVPFKEEDLWNGYPLKKLMHHTDWLKRCFWFNHRHIGSSMALIPFAFSLSIFMVRGIILT